MLFRSVTANVEKALAITAEANIDFATVESGVAATIDPTTAASHSGIFGSPTVGLFFIDGTEGSTVSFTFGTATLVESVTGGDPITFTPNVIGHATDQASATGITSTVTTVTLGAGTAPESNTDKFRLWVGGTLTAATGTGSYTTNHANGTDLNMQVDY